MRDESRPVRPGPSSRETRRRRTLAGAVLIAVFAAGVVVVANSSSHSKHTGSTKLGTVTSTTATVRTGATGSSVPRARPVVRYRETPIVTLGHAVADPAAGAIGNQVIFAAGLDSSGSSTSRVGSIRAPTVQTLPSLPKAFHDAAGAALGNALYLFGGGDGVRQLDSILRVTRTARRHPPAPCRHRRPIRSPRPIGDTAYIVGGYTGTHWLDTIVAFTPDGGPRVVAHLPVGLRYPAVGAADGRLVIVGGTTPSAHATTAIYVFDPATRRGHEDRRPRATDHARVGGRRRQRGDRRGRPERRPRAAGRDRRDQSDRPVAFATPGASPPPRSDAAS